MDQQAEIAMALTTKAEAHHFVSCRGRTEIDVAGQRRMERIVVDASTW
jgi:hypothetical protein